MPDTVSKQGEKYLQEIEDSLGTRAFHRFFNSAFIDCKDFYDLSKADQEKIRHAMKSLADEFAYSARGYMENLTIRHKEPLFTEHEISESPRN